MAQIRDYAKLAKDITASVGAENIISAAHCATRLRLVLKETPSEEVTKQISAMPAVIQVVEKGGQYQIVIGTHAKDVYAAMAEQLHLDESTASDGAKQGIGNRIIATMSAVFAPFVYILAAAGLVQGALIIINLFAPSFADTGTYAVLSFISWTPFTFLPAMIAVTASKHFRCNTFVAMWCCLALVNPDWGSIASRIADGESIKFLIFNMAQTTYTSSVLPPLFLVLVLSYLEHFLEKHIPEVFKSLFVPFICAVIMVPATILVIGPISDGLASAIAIGYNTLYQTVPAIAAAVIGGFWQVAVIFGIHWGVTPMVMSNFENFGCDSFQAVQTCAVVAQAAAALGVFIKSRNKEMKNVALSASLTGLFGITEPAIYGVTLRLKKPFICGCIGGAIGAVIVSFFGSMNYVYAGLPSLLTSVNAISADHPMSFPGELIGCGVSIVIAILLVQFVGFDDPQTASASAAPTGTKAPVLEADIPTSGTTTLYTPMNGEVKALKEVNDPTFAEGILGQGVAIIPHDGKLYAPCDGTVSSVFDTKHAIGITTNDGVELLIHIGLDTVSLGGKHFTAKVKDGDAIKKGDLLIEFDIDAIKAAGLDTITPILVVNVDDFASVKPVTESGAANVGAALLQVNR